MIGNDKKIIQVVISKTLYEYLKKYSKISGVSISSYCNVIISDSLIKKWSVENEKH